MKQIMLDLCKLLKGHNFTDDEELILFDFYNTTGNAIFTMTCRNNQIQLADDVEYYATDIDYTNLTLREYEELIG